MGITFTRAPIVTTGEAVRSRDLRGLARAFSDRIRSGLGDCAWRIGYWWLSPFRLVRNSDASGFLFPPIGEFLETYAHLDPKNATWPVAGPGAPEGANVASQMMGFIFGLEAANVQPEDIRLTDPEGGGIPIWLGTRPPETPSEYWTLAKIQRGAYDPATGALSNGAMWIAQSHAYLQPGSRSMHGYQFGGYVPGPSKGLDCAPPADGSPTPINWQWTFTNLKTGAVLIYGSCPEDPTALAGGAPFYTLDNIVLFHNDGSIDVLPKKDWIDGPYVDNPRLRKLFNGAPERAMNAFIKDFRGVNQRPEKWTEEDGWNSQAFDFQRFFESQYLLAPARGLDIDGTLFERYPRFRTMSLSPLPGLLRNQNADADAHPIEPGFCGCGALLTARKLMGAATIEILHNGETVLGNLTLTPTIAGSAEEMVMWDPVYSGTISFRLATPATFSTGGYIEAELAELLDYKPQVRDAYVILRIGGIDFGAPTDGTGLDFDRANEIGDVYFNTGCAVSLYSHGGMEGSLAEANRNAVLDSLRRLSRCVRFIKGDDVVGYAVENGKSVLWVRRYAYGLGGATDLDMFDGIADAIAATAPENGFTNEWVATIDFKALRYLETSIWKPDAYSKFWPLANRCHLLDPDIAADPITRWHFAYGQRFTSPLAVPISEAPSGYTYAQYGGANNHINTKSCGALDTACIAERLAFYKSCRIYEPPPEIEKAETVVEGGDTLVKLTFKTRFHHDPSAPGSIDRDLTTWNVTALRAEGYRTWESGIREFLVYKDTGRVPSLKPGDRSINYIAGGLGDEPWASIWPEIVLVQLPREPYTDDNDTQDSSDTPFFHDELTRMEIYLHAMAPGFIDGKVSMDLACAEGTTGAFDYTFESLCFHAFGGRWMSTLASVATDIIPTESVRPDKPQGFGPLPNTLASAEVFNQFSLAVNLLNTVRVMLPAKLETRDGTSSNQYVCDPFNAAGDLVSASGIASSSFGSDYAVWIDTVPIGGGAVSWSAWGDAPDSFAGSRQATMVQTGLEEWSIDVDERVVEYRWTLLDPDAIEAIPESWRTSFTDNGSVLAVREVASRPERRIYVASGSGRQCHDGLIPSDTVWNNAPGGQAIDFVIDGVPVITCSPVPATGQLVPPPFPYSTIWGSDMVSTNPLNYCAGGPVTYNQLTPLNKETILITIPAADPPTP